MVSEKVPNLESSVEKESGRSGYESGEAEQTPQVREYRQIEYVLVITDGKEELKTAAAYLQENLENLVRPSPKNIGLKLVVKQVPDVSSAVQVFYENPLDVALVVAQKRGLETSGSRIKYLLENFDHVMLTGVVDAYTVRDTTRPIGTGYRVSQISGEELAGNIALELSEMRKQFRKPVYALKVEERQQLEHERRKAIDQILLEEGDYILQGRGGVKKDFMEIGEDPGTLITHVMRPLQFGDVDTAAAVWQRAKRVLDQMALEGVVTFGMDQSIGGGYVVGDLIRLGRLGKPVFGYKKTQTFEEAKTQKAATDFHRELAEQNLRAYEASKGRLRSVWQMANLNTPRIIGVLPDEKSGVVFMEYTPFTIYPIGIFSPSYPNILGELIMLASQNDNLGNLASQLLNSTFVTAAKKVGFFRANPYEEVPMADPVERQAYYSQREALLFRQAASVGLVKLNKEQLSAIGLFFDYLNSGLKLQPEDNALRLDLRVEHIGFDVEGKENKLLPTAKDVIESTQYDGSISLSAVDSREVLYDAGGKKVRVPLHHEISHLKEHPLLRWNQDQAKRITAIALASQQMFESLKGGNGALKWYEVLNWLITVPPNSAFDMQEAAKHVPRLASFGPNETLIDAYRDLEEARQILTIRLPRLYMKSERFNQYYEQAKFVERTIAIRVGHLKYYANRALENLAFFFQEYSRLPQAQEASYGLVRSSLERLAGAKDLPKGNIMAMWDGF